MEARFQGGLMAIKWSDMGRVWHSADTSLRTSGPATCTLSPIRDTANDNANVRILHKDEGSAQ